MIWTWGSTIKAYANICMIWLFELAVPFHFLE